MSAAFVLGLLAGCSPIDVGTLGGPAGLTVDAIEDGAPAGRSGRALTLGDSIRVTAKLANRGRAAVSSLDVRLTFRREPEGGTPEAVPSVVGAAPTSVAAGARSDFVFDVFVPPGSRPGIWKVGAQFQAAGSGAGVAAAAVERTWAVQRPPRVEARSIAVVSGSTDAGGLSVNPGCPAVVSVELRNDGDAGLDVTDVGLVADGRGAGPGGITSTFLGLEPNETIAGQGRAIATLRVEAEPGLMGAVRLEARVVVRGNDVNNGALVVGEMGRGANLDLTAAPGRLDLSDLRVASPARAGETNVVAGVTARYVGARGGPRALTELRAQVEPPPGAMPWVARITSPAGLQACGPVPNPLCTVSLTLAFDVPPSAPAVATRVGVRITGRDTEGGPGPAFTFGICGVIAQPQGPTIDITP